MKNKMVLTFGCAFVMLTLSCKKQETDPIGFGPYFFEFTSGSEEYKFDVALFDEDGQEGRDYYDIGLAGHSGLTGTNAVGGFNLRLPSDKMTDPRGEYRVGKFTFDSGLYPGSVTWEFQRSAHSAEGWKGISTEGGNWDEQLGTLKITEFVRGDGSKNNLFKELKGTFEFDAFSYDMQSEDYSNTPIKVKGTFHVVNSNVFVQP